jgi:hypothetical protein
MWQPLLLYAILGDGRCRGGVHGMTAPTHSNATLVAVGIGWGRRHIPTLPLLLLGLDGASPADWLTDWLTPLLPSSTLPLGVSSPQGVAALSQPVVG